MRGDCLKKNQKDQMLCLKVESIVKLQDMLSSFVGGHIYTYFYNWDGSLDLVLIVYALVELIIEASH